MKATIILMVLTIIFANIDQYKSTSIDFAALNMDISWTGPIGKKTGNDMSQVDYKLDKDSISCPDQNDGKLAKCWWNELRKYLDGFVSMKK